MTRNREKNISKNHRESRKKSQIIEKKLANITKNREKSSKNPRKSRKMLLCCSNQDRSKETTKETMQSPVQ